MQQGSIVNLHIARASGTLSEPVPEARAISGRGLEGDRSCKEGNVRQVLLVDKDTLDELDLKPGEIKENLTTTGLDLSRAEAGQVLFIGGQVTMEIVGPCEPSGRMETIRSGLQERINGRRGVLAMVINGGPIKVGDSIRIEP